MRGRHGITLLEVIVVAALIAILLGLLLPAIQRVREAALRSSSTNNVKQIQLAIHNYSSNSDDRLPVLDGHEGSPNFAQSIFFAILPHVEQGVLYRRLVEQNVPGSKSRSFYVPLYISPADPTASQKARDAGFTSYAVNARAFQPGATLNASFPDGTSNTIAMGEHYSICGNMIFNYGQYSGLFVFGHRASFADGGPCPRVDGLCFGDVYPITSGNPPVAKPAFFPSGPRTANTPRGAILPRITTPFQTAPSIESCHWMMPQTPHRSGMITGWMDGSVRISAPGMSQATFWGSVTPDGGEVLADL